MVIFNNDGIELDDSAQFSEAIRLDSLNATVSLAVKINEVLQKKQQSFSCY